MPHTRRTFLGGLAAASIPAVAGAASKDEPPPTRNDLDRYYTFLWLEFVALSEEMGVELHSNSIMYRSGGREAYLEACKATAPSSRARAVLSIGNLRE